MDRVILHCDLNCFYASVELLSHPDLREVPMAVKDAKRRPQSASPGGGPRCRLGAVLEGHGIMHR